MKRTVENKLAIFLRTSRTVAGWNEMSLEFALGRSWSFLFREAEFKKRFSLFTSCRGSRVLQRLKNKTKYLTCPISKVLNKTFSNVRRSSLFIQTQLLRDLGDYIINDELWFFASLIIHSL